MSSAGYRNFDLTISSTGRGGYRARVQSQDAGESANDFSNPFSPEKLESLLAKLGPARRVRSLEAPDLEAAKTLGGELYKAVFSGVLASSLSRSIGACTRSKEVLRIRLRLTEVPELANMPWEFLYDEEANRFLVLSYRTSVVRYLDSPQEIAPLEVTPPLRALVMASSPLGYDALAVDKEWKNLETALGEMPAGLVETERLEKATLSALHERLSRRKEYHIFHFIGHGGFDSRTNTSVLVMEDENRQARFVDGQTLGVLLHNHKSLRLTILNACEAACAASNDVFSGVAQGLIRQEIPAVIAMQFEISDSAAVTFAGGFYEALARGSPVDAALLDARLAIFAADTSNVEWGTPVLYLRAADARIFDPDLTGFEPKIATSPPAQEARIEPQAQAQATSPGPRRPLPPAEPKGILPLEFPFYIARAADKVALDLVGYPGTGVTVSIQASGQMGASSLLRRVVDAAKRAGKAVVHIDFQQAFNPDDFSSPEDFHRRFCVVLSDRLEKPDRVDEYWEKYKSLSIGDRCSKYARYLLESLEENQHLVLAMDEVDRLIDTGFRSSFFGMLRSWHNERAMDDRFERLDLVIVTSLEPNQLIDDPNQSNFNVSGEATLSDFSRDETSTLSDLYGASPTPQQRETLTALIGGHPYLWQLSLHQVAKGVYTFDQLLSAARNDNGPYSRHLSGWYSFLQNKPHLRDGLKNILTKREYDERAFLSLRRVGLVSREGSRVRLRCRLYEDYFREQFNV